MSAIRNVIIGTAGHIDHGKSALVEALTGVHPDRLAEERERGLTIDLGFAPYRHASGATVGIIDVPGHERFIRNMVAGATSVDVVVLVVAADDGVMPQTREHLAILELLGATRGLVALTKVDLVEPDLRELALEDVSAFVAGTFLEGAPILPVSALSGEGLDGLRAALDELIEAVPPRGDEGPFRLPVQRVFSSRGHGLVVTGVPVSGRVAAGDSLELVARGRAVRVRAVQAYGEVRETGRAGHSTALNLAGATRDDVRRGDVVASPGVFRPVRFVAVDYRHVDGALPLRHRHPVRLHVGTAERLGRAAVLDVPLVERGQRAAVQVRLEESVVTAPGDRLLLRDAASLVVLGGGVVLELGEGRLKRFKPRVLDDLDARRDALGDPASLAGAELAAAGARGREPAELAQALGVPPGDLAALLEADLASGDVVRAPGGRLFAGAAVDAVADELVGVLAGEHRRRPLLEWLELSFLRAASGRDEAVLAAALARDDRLETAPGGRVRRRGHRPRLDGEQQAARERVLAALRADGPRPPAIDAAFTGLTETRTTELLEMMRASGEVVVVGGVLFHREALAEMRAALVRHGSARDGAIDIPTLRDELGTTRKYLIPLLEHFDAEGLTARHGDRRVLRQREGGA